MTEIIRHCPDCGRRRCFEQLHGAVGWCPDAVGRSCPEWYCLLCGAALRLGDIPVRPELTVAAGIRDRVA